MSNSLPRVFGTPYETGTVSASLAFDDHNDRVVVDVRFGNVFSETVTPLTLDAAHELRDLLAVAIQTAVAHAEFFDESDKRAEDWNES